MLVVPDPDHAPTEPVAPDRSGGRSSAASGRPEGSPPRPRRGHTQAAPRLVALAALAAILVGGCEGLMPPSGATIQGQDISNLYTIILVPAIVIFFLVEGLLVWSVLRYRRRGATLPAQTHGNTVLEITWTVIPLIIVLVVFGLSMQTLGKVDAKTSDPAVVVDVNGHQWFWDFTFPAQKVTVSGAGTVPTIELPINQTVRFRLHSDNVIHSFYIPQFLFKRDVVPGLNNEFEITINNPGTYTGQCAEFCGFGHAEMRFAIQGVTSGEFANWIAQQQQAAASAAASQGASLPPNAKTLEISAHGVVSFDQSSLSAPAAQPFAIHFTNDTTGVMHNVAILDPSGKVLFKTKFITGNADDTEVAPALQAGTYKFICQVHPNMQGTLTVQ